MIKKAAAVLLALMMIAGAAVSAAPPDIAQSSQKTAIEALYGMNLVFGDGNGNFNPKSEITRIEFLAMVIRALGLEGAAKDASEVELPFQDVPKGHWGRGYAYYAYTLGIVQGISETELGPESMVTYNQAIKMLVSALGYAPYAEQRGGYPGGYLVQAANLRLNDGIKGDERALKREETARLVLNALTVNTMTKMGEDMVEGNDLLTMLGFKKYTGTLTATFDAQSVNKLTVDKIEISGQVYKTTYFVNADLLGASVVFYTKDINGEEIVCYLYEKSKTETIQVSASYIEPATSLSKFVYEQDNKVKTLLISDALKVIYNGKLVGSAHMEDDILKPDSGSVTLRDSDGDGMYEIAIVTEYITLVANAVSATTIYDKYGKHLNIDIDEKQITVYSGGVNASLSDIAAGDILTVAKSIDGEKMTIYVSRESFIGTITEKTEKSGDPEYTIEVSGARGLYSLTSEYLYAISKNNAAATRLSLGDTGIFYVNHIGQIAYADLTESTDDTSYGYILGAELKPGIASSAELRILTLNNRFTVFKTPENSKVYFGRMTGASYERSQAEVSEVVSYLTQAARFAQQLVSYRLNAKDEIVELQLADTKGNNSQYLSRDLATRSMNYTQNLLDQKYLVDENTAVFYIPNSGAYEDIMAAGKYNRFFKTGKVNVTVYDVRDSHVGAIVYLPLSIERYESEADGYETIIDLVNSPVMYIQYSSTVMGEDGETYMQITGIEDGEVVTVWVADRLSGISDDKSNLKPGVAIQYEMNDLTRGRAVSSDEPPMLIVFKVVHDFTSRNNKIDTQTYNYTTSYQVRPRISVMYTTLAAVKDSFVTTTLSNKVAPLSGGTVYMRYNPANDEKFELINAYDLSVGNKAVIRQRYLNTREITVIEE